VKEIFLLFIASRPALGLTPFSVQLVPGSGCEVDLSPTPRAENKNDGHIRFRDVVLS
jgi:hypothetical protein